MLDVNYGGSTGYGRSYRERLNEKWGVVDVDDCVNGARFLVERGVQIARIHAVGLGALADRSTPEAEKRRVTAKLMIDQD